MFVRNLHLFREDVRWGSKEGPGDAEAAGPGRNPAKGLLAFFLWAVGSL